MGVAAAVLAVSGGAIAAGFASASGLQHVLCWCAVQERICDERGSRRAGRQLRGLESQHTSFIFSCRPSAAGNSWNHGRRTAQCRRRVSRRRCRRPTCAPLSRRTVSSQSSRCWSRGAPMRNARWVTSSRDGTRCGTSAPEVTVAATLCASRTARSSCTSECQSRT